MQPTNNNANNGQHLDSGVQPTPNTPNKRQRVSRSNTSLVTLNTQRDQLLNLNHTSSSNTLTNHVSIVSSLGPHTSAQIENQGTLCQENEYSNSVVTPSLPSAAPLHRPSDCLPRDPRRELAATSSSMPASLPFPHLPPPFFGITHNNPYPNPIPTHPYLMPFGQEDTSLSSTSRASSASIPNANADIPTIIEYLGSWVNEAVLSNFLGTQKEYNARCKTKNIIETFLKDPHISSSLYISLYGDSPTNLPAIFHCDAIWTRLKILNFSSLYLAALPFGILQLINLQTLNLSNNRLYLTGLPPGIGQLINLQNLDLSNNRLYLTDLPPGIGQLINLQNLDLSHNKLGTLPHEIGQLINLQTLKVSSSQLTILPSLIGQLINLQTLRFANNKLRTLPQIRQLTKLDSLDLSGNELRALPQIRQLVNLQTLDLSDNKLRALPQISQLINLQTLDLFRNKLRTLPQIRQLTKLVSLGLSCNNLAVLPSEIAQLANLRDLNLIHNISLRELPLEIMQLPSSCVVNIGQCGFSVTVINNIRERVDAPGYSGPRFFFDMFSANPPIHQENRSVEGQLKSMYGEVNKTYLPMKNIPGTHLSEGSLQSWLSRLSWMKDYSCSSERKIWVINNVLDYLKLANENESFRQRFGMIVDGASTTCGDRIALSLLHLDIAYQLATIDLYDMGKVVRLLTRGVWVLSLLEGVAREKVPMLRFVDEIEVYLAYPIMLKERLQLPIGIQTMLHYGLSGVTGADLDRAYDFVKQHLDSEENHCNFLLTQTEWTASLAKNYPEQYQAIQSEKENQSNVDNPNFTQIQRTYNEKMIALTKQSLQKIGYVCNLSPIESSSNAASSSSQHF